MNKKNYTCIVCPQSCNIELIDDNGEFNVSGNNCKRGKKYVIDEYTCPKRMITTTIKIQNAQVNLLPVISSDFIPKELLKKCLDILYSHKVEAPINMGDIIVENILDTGVDIVAARTLKENKGMMI